MTGCHLLVLALVCALAGCVTPHRQYDWGNYDHSLYHYYKDPTKLGELNATLSAVVSAAETNNATVPPGIYAEYGYLQLEQGNNAQAIAMFKKEEALWPEAKVFMDNMIKAASTPANPASTPANPAAAPANPAAAPANPAAAESP